MPWRGPEHPDDFPSLGWALLDWWADALPSPSDASAPLVFTDEQALQLVEWFRLDPVTGKLVYRRGYSRRAKGWGKSPVEAAKSIAELVGPVRFGGWDAYGEPVGVAWPMPLVQIAATSEEQTANTWSVIFNLLTENDGKAADLLGIDAGLTRCLVRDNPGAKLEFVTAAAGSREGARPTYTSLDETHLWTASNGGVKLFDVLRRGIAKTQGRLYETTNSFEIGRGSVAESSFNAVKHGSPGIFADEVEAPREIDGVPVDEHASDEVLIAALDVAYGKSSWVDRRRLVEEVRDPAAKWADSCRFFFNWNQTDSAGWQVISRADWSNCAGAPAECGQGWAGLAVGADQRIAALSYAALQTGGRRQIEVVRHEPGTGWLVAACVAAQAETGQPIWVDPKSPAAGVIPALVKAGVRLHEATLAELVAGCAALLNEVNSGQVVHLGAGSLTEAVRMAEARRTGEAWVFSARASAGDICPLDAVTLAAMASRSAPAPYNVLASVF